jgi:hypothetical protein
VASRFVISTVSWLHSSTASVRMVLGVGSTGCVLGWRS